MIKINYEIYRHDYDRRYESMSFASMSDFKDWMFGLMNQPYKDKYGDNMWFLDMLLDGYRSLDSSAQIRIDPQRGGPHYWIDCVSDNGNIVFSNGKYTNGECYISEGFKAFLKECRDRRDGKEQTFVFGEIAGYVPVVSPEKTDKEKAAELIKDHPSLAREIYALLDWEHMRDDVVSQIKQLPEETVFSDEEIDKITSRFDNALSKNDGYYEAYWLSADYAIDEFVREKSRTVDDVLKDASLRSKEADTGKHDVAIDMVKE